MVAKAKKIYSLDKNGKLWRKNLTDIINQTNEALKIDAHWEHRSFKELGIDAPPTIHLGSKAHALEKKDIHTERGDYNRKVMEIRGLNDFVAKTSASIEAFVSDKTKLIKNEVSDLIDAVVKRHGRLQLPIMSGKYLRKVSHRERLQAPEQMKNFIDAKGIATFDELQVYMNEHGAIYERLDTDLDKSNSRVSELRAKLSAWERYEPYLRVAKKSIRTFWKIFQKKLKKSERLFQRVRTLHPMHGKRNE